MSVDSQFLQALQGASFSFTRRPEPVSGDLRLSWGIGVVLLSLLHSRGGKGSFLKLQFLAHSIRTQQSREQVYAVLQGNLRTADIQVRVEPWLNRAVAIAHGLGLVAVTKGKSVSLTERGKEVATAIDAAPDIFVDERVFLKAVAKRLTEKVLTQIWRMETLF
jgi:hypothetical protein